MLSCRSALYGDEREELSVESIDPLMDGHYVGSVPSLSIVHFLLPDLRPRYFRLLLTQGTWSHSGSGTLLRARTRHVHRFYVYTPGTVPLNIVHFGYHAEFFLASTPPHAPHPITRTIAGNSIVTRYKSGLSRC